MVSSTTYGFIAVNGPGAGILKVAGSIFPTAKLRSTNEYRSLPLQPSHNERSECPGEGWARQRPG